LTTIAGNLWYRSLQNARAERNEMLLLHEFMAKKFICPDKKTGFKKGFDEEEGGKKGKKKAQFAGGLVFEPKSGFYDNIILLLDFNSLYPSIIQEYNLCFTTVDRKPTKNFDGSDKKPDKILEADNEEEDILLPDKSGNYKDAILPMVLRNLVQKRKMVKD
jgi:DNA polymerase alpha subunit A